MADVWLAPYLPLPGEIRVGPWTLLPFRDLARRHCRSQAIFNEARRLRTAYKLKTTIGPFGAMVFPTDGRLGDEWPRDLLRLLNRALVVSVIEQNPSLLNEGEKDDPNAGHSAMTSDNAIVYAHPLTGEGSYVIAVGAMVQHLGASFSEPGRPLPPIVPPPYLPTPLWGSLDDEYATAVYTTLTAGNQVARRLDRAIEWLALAWNNSTAVSEDARVLVFRVGFEALLGGGADTKRNRALLSKLLDEESAERIPRTWNRGPAQPVELTTLEWWFQTFGLLRNKVAHGDVISPKDWLFDDGQRHLAHADGVFRSAIKRTVTRALNEPGLELPRNVRLLRRALRESQVG